MKRFAITGATSMLGLSLIEECIRQNRKILAFVHKGSKNICHIPNSPLIKINECDLSEMADFDVGGEKCDVFYHFAWGNTDKAIRDNPDPQLKNIEYAFDAVKLAARLGCEKFIGSGSQAEYGVTKELITEETRVNPITSYGIAKFAAGKLLQKLCVQFGMVCIWPRIFSVYGEYGQDKALVNYAVDCILKTQKAQFSAATNEWDYLYQSDAARFLYALGEKDVEGGIYNIAYGKSRKLKDFILEIERASGEKMVCEFSTETLSETTPHLKCDISKIVAATGIEPKVSFEKGVKKMLKYYTVYPPPTNQYIYKVRCIRYIRAAPNWRCTA